MEENMQSQGAPQPEQSQQPAPEPKAESSDAEKNKVMAIVGYIIPILFFIPLLSEESKKSPFAKFHANQQLVLLISAVIVNIAGTIIPILGWFIILPIGCIVLLVLAIMGIINAAKGEMKKLPIIGGFEIIK
ncbi:MAG TPA: DUF4870 domain-containing protein [Candidatus Moranbacteria bacterium]|nr:DUF4870 domain-containing protein [Candidatus Moranbacteria bacterium]